ncbi:MAG: hypothetical protein GTN86_10940 [Xanthomonadales bacterium]|nr:hypothetical protein [Xanthomonadales bacterium]NIN60235.1 hypothetical protein [Xanthomonadales bacterium]NIN75593.1 hypothetical protein [Xanthomonadales bacterium]NIO14272.1 hypothetical protein [Xanthomonadales bacterium]NIP12628.1 hypothetical protein [Xanthomonadales bacterium]
MRVFDIYRHPKYGCEAVCRGFSWSAFLVPSVWAVRRGLGSMTVMLVVTTTLMFDIAQIASHWIQQPVIQLVLLAVLVVAFGWKPGFRGYRWHAEALRHDNFHWMCTIVADNRRQAIRAANDDRYGTEVRIVADSPA